MSATVLLMCSVIGLSALFAAAKHHADTDFKNFFVRNVLEDGEQETRINLNGVSAKEVSVGGGDGIRFRQLTDGRHFIQLIYDSQGILRDCEFLQDGDSVHKFLDEFGRDVRTISATGNATVLRGLRARTMPEDVRPWLHYRRLRRECARRHREIQRKVRSGEVDDDLDDEDVDDGFVDEGRSNSDDVLGDGDDGMRNHSRNRRSLKQYLIMPGTLWCGYSHIASKYTALGAMSATDQCCRRHDHCPYNIPGMGRRHGQFNRSPFTISLCSCDLSFRACLKMVGTSDANIVGKLFFNVVQTKCFVFKPRKTCVQRSWWGKCLKTKHKRQAILRDNVPY